MCDLTWNGLYIYSFWYSFSSCSFFPFAVIAFCFVLFCLKQIQRRKFLIKFHFPLQLNPIIDATKAKAVSCSRKFTYSLFFSSNFQLLKFNAKKKNRVLFFHNVLTDVIYWLQIFFLRYIISWVQKENSTHSSVWNNPKIFTCKTLYFTIFFML